MLCIVAAAAAAATVVTTAAAAPALAIAAQPGTTTAAAVTAQLGTYDVECGWFEPRVLAKDRRTLPSANGARCLVGHCVCSSRFEERYGCPRCTILEKLEYSYSNQDFEKTTEIRDEIGRHIDLCSLPVGGAPCKVGTCKQDSRNRTLSCDGDVLCDASGSGSGMCVGVEGSIGTCVCARGYFCTDCSLHERDVRDGARCGKYISGGALCRGHDDCSQNSACVTKENRSFCHCDRGYSCRRCEHHLAKLELGKAKCPCDEPVLEPFSGEFKGRHMKVKLTGAPWDAEDECEIRYHVEMLVHAPWRPPWTTESEAIAWLTENGTKLHLGEEHAKFALSPNKKKKGHVYDKQGKKLTKAEHFYVVAVTIPRHREGWLTTSSHVVQSGLYTLSSAPQGKCPAVTVIALVLSVATLATSTRMQSVYEFDR